MVWIRTTWRVAAFRFPGHAHFAGQLAFGGPVGRNLPYLAGERGPKISTPGSNGSTLTNASLHTRSGFGTSDDCDGLGSTLAQAIRYQTFALLPGRHNGHLQALNRVGLT